MRTESSLIVHFAEPIEHLIWLDVMTQDSISALEPWFSEAAGWKRLTQDFYSVEHRDLSPGSPLQSEFLDEVRATIEQQFQVPLSKTIKVTLQRIRPGAEIGVHNDDPALGYETHRLIVYLANRSMEEDGGRLLLRRGTGVDVARAICVQANLGVGLCLNETSYHQVEKVRRFDRNSVIFGFWHVGNSPEVETLVEARLEAARKWFATAPEAASLRGLEQRDLSARHPQAQAAGLLALWRLPELCERALSGPQAVAEGNASAVTAWEWYAVAFATWLAERRARPFRAAEWQWFRDQRRQWSHCSLDWSLESVMFPE